MIQKGKDKHLKNIKENNNNNCAQLSKQTRDLSLKTIIKQEQNII